MNSIELLSVNTATATLLPTTQGLVQSGIRKRPNAGRVAVGPQGLAGDEQADLTVHGGVAKAVYAYPAEHYPFWQTVRGQAKVAGELPFGAMGENLSLRGLLEGRVWAGDRLRFPDCELIVTAPRIPCFKFAAVMGFAQAVSLMAQSGYCGFYLAVHREGSLAPGDSVELIPGPRELRIDEHFRAVMRKKAAR
ncbi:MOSC domain-containing protein [Roseateles paludis]|uniref:MOSC domain-containing protein n=1 Tax=Roseateles paludis TaxID=3145238 RepID=UPI003D32E68F